MEVIKKAMTKIKGLFVKPHTHSQKLEINSASVKLFAGVCVFVFIAGVLMLPDDVPVEFSEKKQTISSVEDKQNQGAPATPGASANSLWAAPSRSGFGSSGGGSEVNHNTSMVIGSIQNAKTQLQAGFRIALRLIDKSTVSQDAVPILAQSILDGVSESGLRIPAGTRFYGEASFQKGSDRATIRFRQISLPSGQIRKIQALGLSKDGQPGVPGKVFSDGLKNTTGQLITTFVGAMAAGSIQTDLLGRSRGGIENGLLSAVSATAQTRAQSYGENLKAEREWIELNPGTEFDALLSEDLKLIDQGGGHE
jgi:hypothetical protein